MHAEVQYPLVELPVKQLHAPVMLSLIEQVWPSGFGRVTGFAVQ
jgi:hypothetical protein